MQTILPSYDSDSSSEENKNQPSVQSSGFESVRNTVLESSGILADIPDSQDENDNEEAGADNLNDIINDTSVENNQNEENNVYVEYSGELMEIRQILQSKNFLSDKSKIPPETSLASKVSPELQGKITAYIGYRDKGVFFNDRLDQNPSFKNPMIMDKMISFLKLDQYGSNFDPKKFVRDFPDDVYYDVLETKKAAVNPYLTHMQKPPKRPHAVQHAIEKAKSKTGLDSRFAKRSSNPTSSFSSRGRSSRGSDRGKRGRYF